jgi:diaminopimelate epimerase
MKMSGAGNDFIVAAGKDAVADHGARSAWIREICRRRVSVGADGVLLVDPAGPGRIRTLFFNPDGTEAFCGNGSRCAARFALLRDWAGRKMVLETMDGEVPAEVADDEVRLVLPPPVDLGKIETVIEGVPLRCRWIRAGVPHLVVAVASVEEAPLEKWGPLLRRDPAVGPEGVNVDLVSGGGTGEIRIRTWERGVEGETLSCGTGAVAAAMAERLEGGTGEFRILPKSGIPLAVEIRGDTGRSDSATLTGDAKIVFEGVIEEGGS